MPTSVATARQCLTDEAAHALDEAVSVARRRSHFQKTSLHAVSPLLSLPSFTLRDAYGRARSSSYSSRLQFRALEICVGVSLDRLPSAKASVASLEEPPVSNSLMAAIKRAQATQRRHPESFHLQQMHSNQQTTSFLKVWRRFGDGGGAVASPVISVERVGSRRSATVGAVVQRGSEAEFEPRC